MEPEPAAGPARTRRRLYLALLAAGLLAAFGAAYWRLYGRPLPLVEGFVEVPVFGFVLAAVLGLRWLRPRPVPYGLGALGLALAFAGLWLTGPAGGRWWGRVLAVYDEPGSGRFGTWIFGYLSLLFPVGWVLLGASVARWRAAVASYLAPGALLVLASAAAGLFGPPGDGPGQMPPWVPAALLLAWPGYLLIALGAFGHTFG